MTPTVCACILGWYAVQSRGRRWHPGVTRGLWEVWGGEAVASSWRLGGAPVSATEDFRIGVSLSPVAPPACARVSWEHSCGSSLSTC